MKEGGRRRRLTAKEGGKACVQWGGLRRAVKVEENNSHPNNMYTMHKKSEQKTRT